MDLSFLKNFTQKNSLIDISSSSEKKPFDIQKNLNNIQRVISMIETTRPFITEYGPMIKNLPKMYKLMKMMKTVETENNHVNENKTKAIPNETTQKKENDSHKQQGQSVPKLYI